TARLEVGSGAGQETPDSGAPPPAASAQEPEADDLDMAGGGGRLLGLLGAPTQTRSLRASIVFATFLHVLMLVLVTAGVLVGSARKPVTDVAAEQQSDGLLARFTTAAQELDGELEQARAAAAHNEGVGRSFALGALLIGSLVVGLMTGLGISSSQLVGGALG